MLCFSGINFSVCPDFEKKIVLFLQEDLEKKSPAILKSYEVGADRATVAEQPTLLSFQHKSLQEFSATKFIKLRLERTKDVKVLIFVESTPL